MARTSRSERPDETQVIRGRNANRLFAADVLVAFILAIVAVAVSKAHVVGAVAAVGMLLLGVRIRMMGVRVTSHGIQIIETYSSTTVPWEDIERFEIEPLKRYPYATYLVRNGNGGRIPILAMTGGSAHTFDKIRVQVNELNELATNHRSVPPTEIEFLDALK